jgi:hypothetical protein
MDKPHCCYINPATGKSCGREAEWRIDPSVGHPLDRYTEACTAHVGELLTDAPEHCIRRLDELDYPCLSSALRPGYMGDIAGPGCDPSTV